MNIKNEKKKKGLGFKIFLGVISTLLILCIIGISSVYFLLNKVDNIEINTGNLHVNEEVSQNKPEVVKEIKNIALFGIDSEDGTTGRSDAIMVATIDSYHKKLKLTSIMRDSYVNIPNYEMDKINHAYAYGGPELAISTINSNFGLNIEDFISVNFSSLPAIIDLLGGVEISITEEEVSHIPGIDSPGMYNLTGEQALSYSRIRYASGNDYARTQRQRTVLNSLFNKLSQNPITSYPEILSKILPYIQSNMSTTEIISTATKAAGIIQNGLDQDRFPRDGYCEGIMLNDVYYLSFDLETTKQQFMSYIFEDK